MKADGNLTRGRDFDVNIATTEIKDAVTSLVDCAPTAKHAALVNIGDFTHSDKYGYPLRERHAVSGSHPYFLN